MHDRRSMARRSRPAVVAAASVAVLLGACSAAFPSVAPAPSSSPIAMPTPNVALRQSLDPASRCVVDPDPAHHGRPAPPSEVAAAGDPIKPTGVVSIRAVGLGELVLRSDRLLVGDLFAMGPFFLPDLPSVDLGGFTGQAPVCLHVARLDPPDERAAFLEVRLTDQPVTRWDLATGGFGVDGGAGGVASTEAVRAADSGDDQRIFDTFEANSVNTWGWLDVVTDPATGANVIGFATGYGDGGYPVYTGLAADGSVASVVIDLLVVPWRWLAVTGPVSAN
jgi:hypothetical protein